MMDFRLGERSDAFRDEVRAFLGEHFSPEMVERAHDTGTSHNWEFHRALGAQGWIAASWPEEYGGQGRDPMEMTALRDELRIGGVPTDGLGQTIMIARTLRAVGTDEQKQQFIPPALAGEILFALGYTEPDSGSDVAAAKTARRARRRRVGHRRPEDVHDAWPTRPPTSSCSPGPIPTSPSTRASPCSWCRSTRRAWRSTRCTRWAVSAPTPPSTPACACPTRCASAR